MKKFGEWLQTGADFVVVFTFFVGIAGYIYGFSFITSFLVTLAGYEGSPFTFYTQADIVRLGIISIFSNWNFFIFVLLPCVFLLSSLGLFKNTVLKSIILILPILIVIFFLKISVSLASKDGIKEAEKYKIAQPNQTLRENLVYRARLSLKTDEFNKTTAANNLKPKEIVRDVYMLSHTGGYIYYVESWGRLKHIPDEKVVGIETSRGISPLSQITEKDVLIRDQIWASTKLRLTNSTKGNVPWEVSTIGKRNDVIEMYIFIKNNTGTKPIENAHLELSHSKHFHIIPNTAKLYQAKWQRMLKASNSILLIKPKDNPLPSGNWLYFVIQGILDNKTPTNKPERIKVNIVFSDNSGKVLKTVGLNSQIYVVDD